MNTETPIEILGHKMIVNPDDKIISQRLRQGIVYEKNSIQAIINNVRKGQTFINIGANIGYFTLILSRAVGEKGRGYAFEPDPDNFRYLKKNVELNGYENIILEQRAVGDETGIADFYLNNKGNKSDHRIWEDRIGGVREIIEVEMICLDEYFKGIDLKIDFIKMDIQGAEALALSGMENILAENKNLKILMEFWPYGLKGCGSDPLEMVINLLNYGFYSFNILEDGILRKTNLIRTLETERPTYKNYKNIWWERPDMEA